MSPHARATSLAGLVAGCTPAYTCEDDAQCIFRGEPGTCEETGFCSYPSDACPSGGRYGPHAGDLSGMCTQHDAATGGSEAGGTGEDPFGREIPTGEPPPPQPLEGIWISREELATRPTDGAAWQAVLDVADATPGPVSLSNPSDHNLVALANALVCARLDDAARCDRARDALLEATTVTPEADAQVFSIQLLAYVVVADLLTLDPADAEVVRTWLQEMQLAQAQGRTLSSTQEDRPNNWGTQAGATRAAIAIYLGDDAELQATADVFRGWLGARDVYAEFDYGELAWQADPDAPVGVNPVGAAIEGHDVNGVIPDEQRDEGAFQWPPPGTGSSGYAALTGALALGVILHRRGHDVWNWEDGAIGRAWQWHWEVAGYRPSGSREWLIPLVNGAYGGSYPHDEARALGTSMALTAWTHP